MPEQGWDTRRVGEPAPLLGCLEMQHEQRLNNGFHRQRAHSTFAASKSDPPRLLRRGAAARRQAATRIVIAGPEGGAELRSAVWEGGALALAAAPVAFEQGLGGAIVPGFRL